jgi:hypothetical protein
MRWIIMTAALGLMAWSSPGLHSGIANLFGNPVDPRAEAAIELRCGSERAAFRDECALELKRDFELGVREPEAILRLHCTRFSSDWTNRPSATSSICEKIYGGWIES